jgi:hypothetical protein
VTTTTKEGLLHRLENMGFNFYDIYCFMIVDSMDFGKHVLFWTTCFILDNRSYFGYMSISLNCFQVLRAKIVKGKYVLKGDTRGVFS